MSQNEDSFCELLSETKQNDDSIKRNKEEVDVRGSNLPRPSIESFAKVINNKGPSMIENPKPEHPAPMPQISNTNNQLIDDTYCYQKIGQNSINKIP